MTIDIATTNARHRTAVPALSVVVPLFNESHSLPALCEALMTRFESSSTEFILVDDGSRDDTYPLACSGTASLPRATTLRLDRNQGKGAAVRAGVAHSSGRVVVFMDADLASDLDGLDPLIAAIGPYDIAVGSRAVTGSHVSGSTPLRTAMGRTYSLVGRAIAGTGVRDSQCGFKAFDGDVARMLFSVSRIERFAFDAEVLRIARILGLRVAEIPVVWRAGEHSSVHPVTDSLNMLIDTVSMRLRTHPSHVRSRAAESGWVSARSDDQVIDHLAAVETPG